MQHERKRASLEEDDGIKVLHVMGSRRLLPKSAWSLSKNCLRGLKTYCNSRTMW
jgi:hypothetical protein